MMKQIPNILTLSRVVASLIVPILIFSNGEIERMLALIIFIVAALSDYLDGVLARYFGAVSRFGRILDPIADKLLLAGCLLALVANDDWGWALFVPALLILLREVFVSGLREISAKDNISIPVTPLAKLKTATQLLALIAAISAPIMASTTMDILTALLFWVAAILTVKSGWGYFKGALRE